jgi:diphthamide synthase (EF-2-diphthine--ammonia ligase)
MGEGGEYESMVLDCPIFKKRLIVKEAEKKMNRSSGTLEVKTIVLEKK